MWQRGRLSTSDTASSAAANIAASAAQLPSPDSDTTAVSTLASATAATCCVQAASGKACQHFRPITAIENMHTLEHKLWTCRLTEIHVSLYVSPSTWGSARPQ